MATQSFKQTAETPVENTELTENPTAALATPRHLEAPAGIEGEINASDLTLPRLNLVQKMSELADSFKAGELVYNKEVPLPQPVSCVVIRMKKQYQQDLPYGSGEMPQMCDTIDEVRAAGGTLEYGEENHYSEIAHMQLLLRRPAEGVAAEHEDLFNYEIGGEHYAAAVFTVAKSAYKSAAKPVVTAAFNTLRGQLGRGLWALTSELKSNPMGTWHVPVMRLAGRTSDELAAFVAQYTA